MKNKYFLGLFILIAFVACSKSNGGKPSISIESVTGVVPVDGIMEAKMKFTQTNGKLSGGTFVAIRKRLNTILLPPGDMKADTISGPIPSFPDNDKGEFVFTLTWNDLHESDIRNDTIALQFAAIDTDANSSDTVMTGPITILFQ